MATQDEIKSQIAALQAQLAAEQEKVAKDKTEVAAASASTSSPVAARLMSGPPPNTPPAVPLPAEPAKKLAESSTPATPATTSVQLIKPGVKTTEFLLTVATDVAATVLLLTHRITTTEWTTLTGGTAALYATARTWIKG